MDWGAALAGIDQEIKNRAALNNPMDQLNLAEKAQTVQNAPRIQARLEAAQQAQEDYWKGLVSAKQQTAEAAIKNRDDANALVDQFNDPNSTPEMRKELIAKLAVMHVKLPGLDTNGKPVLVLQADGTAKPLLDNTGKPVVGAQVIKPTEQGFVPDAKAMQDAVDAARVGNMSLWNALVARGAAGNKAREALGAAYGATRPDDFKGIVAEKAGATADTKVLTSLSQAAATQAVFHETAQKDFEVMKDALKNIPDLNAPWLNAVPRTIAANLLSPAQLGAFNMARVSALREYERMTSSNLEAKGQITDAARHSYEELLNENTPMSTALADIDVMNKDMANLQNAVDTEKKVYEGELAKRGKGKPQAVTPTTTPTASGTPVANHPDTVGTPVHPQFEGFPPLVAAPAGSQGKASQAVVNSLARQFKKTPEEAKAYLIASGYVVQ